MKDAGTVLAPGEVEAYFAAADGSYRFARWGRPIAPIVFGVSDETLPVVKGAVEAVVTLAGHQMVETDPEFGANLMIFFLRNWSELADVPDLDRLIPEMAALVARLESEGANQYRLFRFDARGAIKATFVFLRMDAALTPMPVEDLALTQAVQMILVWGEGAFSERSPLAQVNGTTFLRPEVAGLIRAAYDPLLPSASVDASHALRLFARVGAAV